MMKKLGLLTFCMAITAISLAQDVSYKYRYFYDANGNRTKRLAILMPTVAARSGKITNNANAIAPLSDSVGEIKIKIYPNPTKGILKIDIVNYPKDAKGFISLIDMQGRALVTLPNVFESNIVDISEQADGNYLMKVVIGEVSKEWMIVKN